MQISRFRVLSTIGFCVVAASAAVVTAASTAAADPATCVSTGSGSTFTHGRADVLDTSAQVLPAVPQAGAGAAGLCAARDGFASFQLEIRATDADLSNVRMTASDLSGPEGAVLKGTSSVPDAIPPTSADAPDVTLAREDYTTLQTMSDGDLADVINRDPKSGACQGAVGHPGDCRFPDALVPDRDTLTGQVRNAFPLAVPAGENRVVWVDVFVPTGTTPGNFTGQVTISSGASVLTTVPVALTVLATTLPATSSLRSGFMVKAYGGTPAATYQQYAELGLNNRLGMTPDGLPTGNAVGALGTLVNGTDANVRLVDPDGTRAHLTDILGVGDFAALRRAVPVPSKAQVWSYCDEWTASYCQSTYAKSARTAWPQVPRAVIDDYVDHKYPDPLKSGVTFPGLDPQPGNAIVVAQELEPGGGASRVPALAAWTRSQARQAWVYTSCLSGGCGSAYTPSPIFSRWPGYSIDEPSAEQSATGWLLYAADAAGDGLDGELYYEVRQTSPTVVSPGVWSSTYNEGVNGDGTLFYPYDSQEVGGSTSIPLESIRLKRIRDGRQDYELLRLAGKSFGVSLVHATYPNWHETDISHATLVNSTAQLYRHFLPVTATPPAQPAPVRVHATTSAAQISWTPAADGGDVITGYQVLASPVGTAATGLIIASCTSTGTSCNISGLPAGRSYAFSVQAHNLAGDGPSSSPTATTIPVPPARTALTLVTPASTTYGRTVAISGRMTRTDNRSAVAGARVQLQYRRAGSTAAFRSIGPVLTTTRTGAVTMTFRPSYPAQLRLIFAASSAFVGAVSPARDISLRRALTLSAPAHVRVSQTVRFIGRCAPACSGHAVHLQRRSHGRWVAVRAVHARRSGRFTVSVRARSVGRFTYRISVTGRSGYLTTASASRAVGVRR